MRGNTVNHADDLLALLYGVHVGSITETRYSVLPDNQDIALFNTKQHQACISQEGAVEFAATGGSGINNALVFQQLAVEISAQSEEAAESNNLRRNEIMRQISREDKKKRRIKKIHPSIIKMICRAAASSSTDDGKSLPTTFSCFINQENVGMAQ